MLPRFSYQMSLNENPYPPLPGVVQAIAQAAEQVNRTTDVFASDLASAIAERLGVPAEHVVAGAGSAALLQQLLSSHAGPGEEVVHAGPSFEAYPVMANISGAISVEIPLREHVHDLDAMAAAVTGATRVVLLCNPNNPTGTVLRHEQVRRFLADLPAGPLPAPPLVVVDEAYRDFADPEATADGIDLYRTDERVCVLRTFSKSYGLLGLRVGFLVAHEPVVSVLRRTLPFFRVNSLGQAAAMAALRADHDIHRRCAMIARERDRVRAALIEAGWSVPHSGANFLWLPLGAGTERFFEFCINNGVLVRAFPGEGVRVTVAERAANDALVELAEKFRVAEYVKE